MCLLAKTLRYLLLVYLRAYPELCKDEGACGQLDLERRSQPGSKDRLSACRYV